MDDRWMFSTIWYRHWIIAQYCIQGCKNVALITYVPHKTLTPSKGGVLFIYQSQVGCSAHLIDNNSRLKNESSSENWGRFFVCGGVW